MMLSCETFAKVTIDPETRFDNKFFRTLLGRMGTEVRTVPTDVHWDSHTESLCIYSEWHLPKLPPSLRSYPPKLFLR
jgi:hypothetical protein